MSNCFVCMTSKFQYSGLNVRLVFYNYNATGLGFYKHLLENKFLAVTVWDFWDPQLRSQSRQMCSLCRRKFLSIVWIDLPMFRTSCNVLKCWPPLYTYREKLLLWKGDHFIDANTKEPIVGNGLDMVHYELDRNSYQCFQCHTQLCLGPELINRVGILLSLKELQNLVLIWPVFLLSNLHNLTTFHFYFPIAVSRITWVWNLRQSVRSSTYYDSVFSYPRFFF